MHDPFFSEPLPESSDTAKKLRSRSIYSIFPETGFIMSRRNASDIYGDFYTAVLIPSVPYQSTLGFFTYWISYPVTSNMHDNFRLTATLLLEDYGVTDDLTSNRSYPVIFFNMDEPSTYDLSPGTWVSRRIPFCIPGAGKLRVSVFHGMDGSAVAIDDIETQGHLVTKSDEISSSCTEKAWMLHTIRRGTITCDFNGNIGLDNHYESCGWKQELPIVSDFSVRVDGSFFGTAFHRDDATNKVLGLVISGGSSLMSLALTSTSFNLTQTRMRFKVMSKIFQNLWTSW